MKKIINLGVVSVLCISMASCANTHQVGYDKVDNKKTLVESNQHNNVSNNSSTQDKSFDLYKHSTASSVKYYDYKKYDDEGRLIPESLSGVKGRFVWENDCLVFISAYGGDRATPILPYGVAKWNYSSKTLAINDTSIKMGDLIETGGVFYQTPSNKQGICWNYPYIVSIGAMGKIRVLESEKNIEPIPNSV